MGRKWMVERRDLNLREDGSKIDRKDGVEEWR